MTSKKPIKVSNLNNLLDSVEGAVGVFFEDRSDTTMKTAQMDMAGYTGPGLQITAGHKALLVNFKIKYSLKSIKSEMRMEIQKA